MSAINAILIDDEKRAVSVLSNLLSRTYFDVNILGSANNLQEGIKLIKELHPNVVFLDVQMPNEKGYEIINYFQEIDFIIIFVTAYDKYAIKAFELNALDYLLKPVNRIRLEQTLALITNQIENNVKLNEYYKLISSFSETNVRKIVIPELNNRRILDPKNIVAFEAERAYTIIHLDDEKKVTASKNLKHFDDIFENDDRFFRTHRSWVVNINFLSNFNRTKSLLMLKHGVKARISRNNYEAFDNYIQ